LIATVHGIPIAWALTGAKADERAVLDVMLDRLLLDLARLRPLRPQVMLGITHLGGRPTTRSEQPPTCRDRNWIAVVGPGTYGRGAALYVAQAGSTVPEPRREPIQVPPERLQDGT
jgi:hypothetical protein